MLRALRHLTNASLPVLLFAAAAGAQAPFPGVSPVSIGMQLPANFESSGALWHPRLQHYFIVGDEGHVAEIEANGVLVRFWTVAGDLEAVTVADPQSNFIYLGCEDPDSILEFNIVTGVVTRVFNLTFKMTGPANRGLEGLAFVPDPADPEGGLFYAGHQDEGSVYLFRCPIKSTSTSTAVIYVTKFTPIPGVANLHEVTWDPGTGTLYHILSDNNTIVQTDKAGVVKNQWHLPPGTNQEGLAVRGCEIVVAYDQPNTILKYRSFPSTSTCDTLWVDTTSLSIASPSTANFALQMPDSLSGSIFILVGSASGTTPGFDVDNIHIPLNYDWYFDTIGGAPNSAAFVHTFATLDGSGGSFSQLVLPAGVPPTLVGTDLDHAYVVLKPSPLAWVAVSGTARVHLGT
jgi:uncharacterized protein YjiK